jgi:hypothetical protein
VRKFVEAPHFQAPFWQFSNISCSLHLPGQRGQCRMTTADDAQGVLQIILERHISSQPPFGHWQFQAAGREYLSISCQVS